MALNSWDEQAGPTFRHGAHATRIDHFLTRLSTCDGAAENVQHLMNASIVPVSQTHHVPIRCSLKSCYMTYQVHSTQTSCTYQQRNHCRRASQQDADEWIALRHAVLQALPERVQESQPESVIRFFMNCFPNPSKNGPSLAMTWCTGLSGPNGITRVPSRRFA